MGLIAVWPRKVLFFFLNVIDVLEGENHANVPIFFLIDPDIVQLVDFTFFTVKQRENSVLPNCNFFLKPTHQC